MGWFRDFISGNRRNRCLECSAPFGLVSYPNNERKFCSKECMVINAEPPDQQAALPFRPPDPHAYDVV